MLLLLAQTNGTLSLGIVFWIVMLLWLVGGFWVNYSAAPNYRAYGGHILLWFVLFLIGWQVFGFPIGK